MHVRDFFLFTDPRRRKLQACHHGGLWVQACPSNPHSLPICVAGSLLPEREGVRERSAIYKLFGHQKPRKERRKKRDREREEPTISFTLSFFDFLLDLLCEKISKDWWMVGDLKSGGERVGHKSPKGMV